MTFETWLAYVTTVLLFMVAPGPSQLLIASVSLTNGAKRSLATMAGDLSANTLQIMAAGLGLAALVFASQSAFQIVKWAGVAYLVYIAWKLAFGGDPNVSRRPRASVMRLYRTGFIASAANPKAVVFFAALFPQFINTSEALLPQVVILGATYLIFDACFLSAYSILGSRLRAIATGPVKRWIGRIAGGAVLMAAGLLALKPVASDAG